MPTYQRREEVPTMSFSGDAKGELCRQPVTRRCCAQAESYGILLYVGDRKWKVIKFYICFYFPPILHLSHQKL